MISKIVTTIKIGADGVSTLREAVLPMWDGFIGNTKY